MLIVFHCLLGLCPFRSLLLIRWSTGSPGALKKCLHRFFLYSFRLRLQPAISSQQKESRFSVCCLCLQAKQACPLFFQLIADQLLFVTTEWHAGFMVTVVCFQDTELSHTFQYKGDGLYFNFIL